MTGLLDRLRRDDAAALEEVGHRFLPFFQAIVLAQGHGIRDSKKTLEAFTAAVARAAARATDPAAFAPAVMRELHEGATAIPLAEPDPAQTAAVAKLVRLRPMPPGEREWVIARFVERLGAQTIAQESGAQVSAVLGVLARGAELLAGGEGWEQEAALADPDAAPPPQLVDLENMLSALAIDVSALELEPLKPPVARPAAPLPSPQPDSEALPPSEQTQGALNIPAEVSKFIAAAPAPVPWSEGSAGSLVPLMDEPEPAGATTRPMVGLYVPPPDGEVTSSTGSGPARASDTVSSLTPVSSNTVRGLAPVPEASSNTVAWLAPVGGRPVARRILDHFRKHRQGWWATTGACALLGVSLFLWGISRVRVATRSAWDLVPVIVAARDLPEGETIATELVAIRAVPSQFVTPSVVTPDLVSAAYGQVLSVGLQAGDPLQWSQFESAKANQRLSRKVIRSQRAFSIPVSEVKSVGGWLQPSQTADLVWTAGGNKPEAITLLQNVTVLAVGKVDTLNVGGQLLKYTTLSLLLDPEEAEQLALAAGVGELTATLRATGDEAPFTREGRTTLNTLLTGARAKLAEQKRLSTIQMIRGGQ